MRIRLPQWLNPGARTLRYDFDLSRRERVAYISVTLAAVTDATRLFDEVGDEDFRDKGLDIVKVLMDSLDQALMEEDEDDHRYA